MRGISLARSNWPARVAVDTSVRFPLFEFFMKPPDILIIFGLPQIVRARQNPPVEQAEIEVDCRRFTTGSVQRTRNRRLPALMSLQEKFHSRYSE